MVKPVRWNTASRSLAHMYAPIASRLSCSLVDGVSSTTAPDEATPAATISSTEMFESEPSLDPSMAASTSRVTSTYASSMLARSTCSHWSASAAMTLHDARLYRLKLTLRRSLSCEVPSVFSVGFSPIASPSPAVSAPSAPPSSSPMVSTCTHTSSGTSFFASTTLRCRFTPLCLAG